MIRKLWESKTFRGVLCGVVATIAVTIASLIANHIEMRELKKEGAAFERFIQEQNEQLMQSGNRKPDTDQSHSAHAEQKPTDDVNLSAAKRKGSITENGEPIAAGNGKPSSEKRYTSGIYKGMTYKEAMQQWKIRDDEVTKRLMASTNRSLELADAQLKSSRDERSTLLSFFKHVDPDQLELARQEALELFPDKADALNTFFNDLANHGGTKSLEEIAQDADSILTDRQAWRVAFNQNNAVFDQVKQDLAAVNKDKPTPP